MRNGPTFATVRRISEQTKQRRVSTSFAIITFPHLLFDRLIGVVIPALLQCFARCQSRELFKIVNTLAEPITKAYAMAQLVERLLPRRLILSCKF